ncbi:MAG: hypothetical protein ACKOHK_08410, partial [Planctomycetia bacterium]
AVRSDSHDRRNSALCRAYSSVWSTCQRAGAALALASQASSWQVLQTEEYARQSAEFRRSCESLRTAGRERNIDAAVLAWLDVTMKCVQCHKYVRSAER